MIKTQGTLIVSCVFYRSSNNKIEAAIGFKALVWQNLRLTLVNSHLNFVRYYQQYV